MQRDVLQVQHLRAGGRQRAQEAALAAAGDPADDLEAQGRGRFVQALQHEAPVGPVAPLELPDPPADAAEDLRHAAGALPAAPAVDQRAPFPGTVVELFLQVARDVARHQRRAGFPGRERGHLLVQGADAGAFGVVEHRGGDRAGHAVERVFRRRAHVDDGVEGVEVGAGDGGNRAQAAFFSRGWGGRAPGPQGRF